MGAGYPDKPLAVMHAPLTVLPTPFPEKSFWKAVGSMRAFNTLIDNVSRDDEYLQTTLRPAAEYDDFTVSRSPCSVPEQQSIHYIGHASCHLMSCHENLLASDAVMHAHIQKHSIFTCYWKPSESVLAHRHQLF